MIWEYRLPSKQAVPLVIFCPPNLNHSATHRWSSLPVDMCRLTKGINLLKILLEIPRGKLKRFSQFNPFQSIWRSIWCGISFPLSNLSVRVWDGSLNGLTRSGLFPKISFELVELFEDFLFGKLMKISSEIISFLASSSYFCHDSSTYHWPPVSGLQPSVQC